MKHVKIIITLTIVVLISTVLIFFVEGVTSEVIRINNLEAANAAKLEVLPGVLIDDLVKEDGETPIDPEDYDYGDSTIIELIFIPTKGYIYTAHFKGYNPDIRYMLAIDMEGTIVGFKVLFHGESPGFGDSIADEDFRIQFNDLSQEDAIDGNIDELAGASGAPVTAGAFKDSLKSVIEFHQAKIEGVEQETPEEELARWKDEITFTDALFTDVSDDYTIDDSLIKVEMANDGTNDLNIIYTVRFIGFVGTGYVEYMIAFDLETNDITGLRILHNDETAGYGSVLSDEEYNVQFDDFSKDDAIDGNIDVLAGVSEAPVTTLAFKASLKEITEYHLSIFDVEERPDLVEVLNEDLLAAYPLADSFVSVYEEYLYNEKIGNIYEVYDVGSNLIGYVYYVELVGLHDISFTFGIDLDGTTKQINIIDSSETWNQAQDAGIYDGLSGIFPETDWLDNFENVLIQDLLLDPIDEVAGVSVTTGSILLTIEELFYYHLFEFTGGGE